MNVHVNDFIKVANVKVLGCPTLPSSLTFLISKACILMRIFKLFFWRPRKGNRRRRRLKCNKQGWLIIAFALGCCFESFFISLQVFASFNFSSLMMQFDQPLPTSNSSVVMRQLDQPLQTPGTSFRRRPAVLQIQGEDLRYVTSTLDSFPQQRRTNWYWIDNNDFAKKDYYQPKRRDPGCVPLASWQDELHPSCLDFHTIDFEEIEFAAHGNKRDTWMYREHDGTKRALKMLRALNTDHNHTYDYVNAERHRMDAVASMVLSKSPYVADIFGYCSSSAIYDFAGGGHLWTIFNRPPPRGDGPEVPPTKDELFMFAHDAAMGLADAHHVRNKLLGDDGF